MKEEEEKLKKQMVRGERMVENEAVSGRFAPSN